MRSTIVLLLLVLSCAPARPCARDWSIPTDSLVRKIDDVASEQQRFMKTLELETLPAEARASVENGFAVSFADLAAAQKDGAEIWSFRYDKCPGCGWPREGYVAIRDCRIVMEVETSETM